MKKSDTLISDIISFAECQSTGDDEQNVMRAALDTAFSFLGNNPKAISAMASSALSNGLVDKDCEISLSNQKDLQQHISFYKK